MSIGATVWSSEHPLSSERSYKMADYALYRMNSRGRNGVDIIPHPHALVMEQITESTVAVSPARNTYAEEVERRVRETNTVKTDS